MKKNYLIAILCLCLFPLVNIAQTADYGFLASTGTYAPLISATSVNGTTVWDDEEWTVSIGFTFNFFGQPFTDVTISDGYVFFDVSENYVINALGADLEDRGDITSASPISTLLEGTAGSRIFKIEWKNAGFYDGTSSDSINFQLWLHEGTNEVSMIYGTSGIANVNDAFFGETGAYILLLDDGNNKYHHLEGDPASPTMNPDFSLIRLTGVPANGQVYLFGDVGLGINNNASVDHDLNIYPNPCKDVLNISSRLGKPVAQQMQVFDLTGKKVMDVNPSALNKGVITLNTSNLNSGVYFLQIITDKGTFTRRINKQ